MADFKLPFFSRGEISPRLYGRVDTAAYQSGLKTARNAIVGVGGAVFNRPGTIYIAPTKYFDRYTRLIPFAFNAQDTCMLEFGDGYMRVIREDFPQLSLDVKTITAVTLGITTKITAVNSYVEGQEIVIANVVGTTELNGGRYVVHNPTGTDFYIRSKISGNDVDSSLYTAYVSGGEVDSIYEIVTPWTAADLPLVKFAQSADVLTMVHVDYPIQELQRFALNDWRIATPDFIPVNAVPQQITGTVTASGSDSAAYTVTAIDDTTGVESLAGLGSIGYQIVGATRANPIQIETGNLTGYPEGQEVFITGVEGMTELNDRRFFVQNVNGLTFELRDEDGTDYGTFTGASVQSIFTTDYTVDSMDGTATANLISWSSVEGAARYSIYKGTNGIFGYIGSTTNLTFFDNNFAPDLTQTPPVSRNPFLKEGDRPGAVGFHQQRRLLGGSKNRPNTWLASKVGDYINYGISFPVKDDDAIDFTLDSGSINQIKHFLSAKDLALFTTGQEWSVSSGGEVAFSPLSADATPETNWGVADHRPFMVGKTMVFVQEDNRTVRSFGYDYNVAGYKSTELSLFAEHIFQDHGIKDWAYARTPYSAMIMTRVDGLGCGVMVFNEEQSVIGWTRWDTRGIFNTVGVVRVCVEHETPEPDDGIYFTVTRSINGNRVQFIERLHKRRFTDVRDAFFVDCGRSWDRPMQITQVEVETSLFNPSPFDSLILTIPNHGYIDKMVIAVSDLRWYPNIDDTGNEVPPQVINDQNWIVKKLDANRVCLQYLTDEDRYVKSTDFADFTAWLGPGAARETTDTLINLEHLEGETVSVLADGYPLRGVTVTNGKIVLPGLTGRAHVGFPYTTDIELLDVEPNLGSNTIQGKHKKVNKVTVRFDKSREMLIGPDSSKLIPMKRAPFTEQSAQLFSGDRVVVLTPAWNTNGRIFFRMTDPMPFSILAVFPDMDIA